MAKFEGAHAHLSPWQAGALVVGSMVGTGVFTTTGLLCATLGGSRPTIIAAWILGGLLALCGACVYAEIGAMFPHVGGEYVYLARAFHPAVGFVSGWLALLVGFAAPVAAGATAFGRYLEAALFVAPAGEFARAAGVMLIVALTALHAREVVWAARLQVVVTATMMGAMLLLIVAGGIVAWGHDSAGVQDWLPGHAPAPAAGIAGMGVALVLVSYSYFGWNAAAYVAGELEEPGRTLPRALILGCALVTAVYVALNVVFLSAVSPAALMGKVEVAHIVARALVGDGGARVVSLLIAFVLAGSVSALIMTRPRVATTPSSWIFTRVRTRR